MVRRGITNLQGLCWNDDSLPQKVEKLPVAQMSKKKESDSVKTDGLPSREDGSRLCEYLSREQTLAKYFTQERKTAPEVFAREYDARPKYFSEEPDTLAEDVAREQEVLTEKLAQEQRRAENLAREQKSVDVAREKKLPTEDLSQEQKKAEPFTREQRLFEDCTQERNLAQDFDQIMKLTDGEQKLAHDVRCEMNLAGDSAQEPGLAEDLAREQKLAKEVSREKKMANSIAREQILAKEISRGRNTDTKAENTMAPPVIGNPIVQSSIWKRDDLNQTFWGSSALYGEHCTNALEICLDVGDDQSILHSANPLGGSCCSPCGNDSLGSTFAFVEGAKNCGEQSCACAVSAVQDFDPSVDLSRSSNGNISLPQDLVDNLNKLMASKASGEISWCSSCHEPSLNRSSIQEASLNKSSVQGAQESSSTKGL